MVGLPKLTLHLRGPTGTTVLEVLLLVAVLLYAVVAAVPSCELCRERLRAVLLSNLCRRYC